MVRGGPAPNAYALPPCLGPARHDPTKQKCPAYTIRPKPGDERLGLGPGFYKLQEKTRFGPARAPAFTMGAKLPEINNHHVPAPSHYRPEKYIQQKNNPPKFTMAKRTEPLRSHYVPAPDTYKPPSTFGLRGSSSYTMGMKIKTPRGEGIPAPDRYGPVNPDLYKPAGAKFTIRKRTGQAVFKTQVPAPNTYFPKLKDKLNSSKFSFRQRDVNGRVICFTEEDIKGFCK